jgi:hypothetical protein
MYPLWMDYRGTGKVHVGLTMFVCSLLGQNPDSNGNEGKSLWFYIHNKCHHQDIMLCTYAINLQKYVQ